MELSLRLAEQMVSLFLMGSFGYLLAKAGLVNAESSRPLTAVSLYILNPCLMLGALLGDWTYELLRGALLAAGLLALSLAFCCVITVPLRRVKPMSGADAMTIVFSNTAGIILPLIQMTLGREYLMYVSLFPVIFNLIIWSYGTVMLKGSTEETGSPAVVVGKLFTNPATLSIFIGAAIAALRIPVPQVIENSILGMSACVAPVSMILIGILCAELSGPKIRGMKGLAFPIVMRLVGYPALLIVLYALLERVLGLQDIRMILIIVLMAMAAPGAALIVQLSQMYRVDQERAACLHVLTTVFCIFTLPVMTLLAQMAM